MFLKIKIKIKKREEREEKKKSSPELQKHSVRRHPREVRWTVTPSKGKDSDSNDSRKTFIILMF